MAANDNSRQCPSTFAVDTYCEWHGLVTAEDNGLQTKVEQFREDLKNRAATDLIVLGHLLDSIAQFTNREVRYQSSDFLGGRCEVPTSELRGRADTLFKPVRSILEKMWRKNIQRRSDSLVKLANLGDEIRDLVRTSVVCPTLAHAKDYKSRLRQWKTFLPKPPHEENAALGSEYDFNTIDRIDVDDEAKLASGYFAYHAQVTFQDGITIEVQIYSKLFETWRGISHLLYEAARTGHGVDARPGSPDSRLVSLGHVLHLADLELERLALDYGKK